MHALHVEKNESRIGRSLTSEILIAVKNNGKQRQGGSIMTAIDDPWDRVYKTTQAYNYEKREEAFITSATHEEALKNADQLIGSEEMAKMKAERKEAKKKRQKERRQAEKAPDNHNEQKTPSNSAKSLDIKATTTTNKAESVEESEDERLECLDPDEQIDDESLDIIAAFVKVSVKQNKNVFPNKTSVPKSEKVCPPLDSTYNPMPKFMKPKITQSQSDIAETLGTESCYLALNDNDFEKAIDFLSQAIFLAPEDIRHFLNRSYCYLRVGQYSQALSDARFAKKKSQLTEHFAKAVVREGQALCGLQQYHEAEKCFEEILKLEEGNEWILTELTLARALQLTNMGFSMISALNALQQCSAVIDAVTLLTSGNVSGPELETDNTDSAIESWDGDEIYISDDESSSTISLSKLVSAITDESCYLEELRSQPSSSKTQQFSKNSDRILKGSASMESLSRGNGIRSNGNAQWETRTNVKFVASTSKTRIQKPSVADGGSIWVGNIDKTVTERKLREVFEVFGKINYIQRFYDERNYAFIDFDNKKAAAQVLKERNNVEINGIKLPVKPALGFSGRK